MINIIVAMSQKNVIGKDNALPWHLPADLQHFKTITMGHTVVMGRKTYESILSRLGKPLPGRDSVVLTHNVNFRPPGVKIAHSFREILKLAKSKDEIFVIGGADIYQQALGHTQRIYLTKIDADIKGDTFFPELLAREWREVSREAHKRNLNNPHNFTFVTLERKTHGE